MYIAKKNGKKKMDLPSLSKKQMINKVGIHRFLIQNINEK